MTRLMEHPRLHPVWRLLARSPLPDSCYYRLLDLLTDNHGWRPLSRRHPEAR